MPLDVDYTNGDNVLNDDTASYEYVSAARPRVERSVMAWYQLLDGVPFGNRAWAEAERGFNSQDDRERLRRYTREAIQWAIDEKLIEPIPGESEVIIEVGDPESAVGKTYTAALKIIFFDVVAGRDDEISVNAPPWGV